MKSNFNDSLALYIEKLLSSKDYYQEYQYGLIDSTQFYEAVLADESITGVIGSIIKENAKLNTLLHDEDKMPTEAIVAYLAENNMIPSHEHKYDGFNEYRQFIYENYNHSGYYTSVHPEDEYLLYAISAIMQPKNAFIAGSYFGYFAVWAMNTISKNGGICVLSDIDRRACALAKENFKRLGFESSSKIMCEDAVKLLLAQEEPIDLLLIDAVGDWNDRRPDYRGKQIYVPMLKAASHALVKGSTIVMHNIRPGRSRMGWGGMIDMDSLYSVLDSINAVGMAYDSYNGIGVYIVG